MRHARQGMYTYTARLKNNHSFRITSNLNLSSSMYRAQNCLPRLTRFRWDKGFPARSFSAITSNAFWAAELKHGGSVAVDIPRGFVLQVRLAALAGLSPTSAVVRVEVRPHDKSASSLHSVLCTLRNTTCEQFALDSTFSDNASTTFFVDGHPDSSVFLSGNYRTNDNLYDLDSAMDWGLDESEQERPYTYIDLGNAPPSCPRIHIHVSTFLEQGRGQHSSDGADACTSVEDSESSSGGTSKKKSSKTRSKK